MNKVMKKIKNNEIINGAMTLGIGTIVAQLISILVQPILTRLCDPKTLGIYATFVSWAAIIIPIASLKLDLLIIKEENDFEVEKIVKTCCRLTILVSICVAIYFNFIYSNEELKYMGVYILPIAVIIHGIRIIFSTYNNRFGEYKLLANISVLRSIIVSVTQIISSFLGFGEVGLSAAYSIAPLYGITKQSKKYRERKHSNKLTIYESVKIIKKNSNHIINLVLTELIRTITFSAITLTIAKIYGLVEVGYYSVSIRVLAMPLSLISVNISQVFFRKLTTEVNKNKLSYPLCIKVIKILGIISIVGFGVLLLIAPEMCKIVFGKEWEVSGYYISILCPLYAVKLIADSLVGIYIVFSKQSRQLKIQSLFIVICGSAYVFSNTYNWSIQTYLMCISIGYTIIYLINIVDNLILCKTMDKAMR